MPSRHTLVSTWRPTSRRSRRESSEFVRCAPACSQPSSTTDQMPVALRCTQTTLMSTATCPSTPKCPLDAKIASLAHDCSCTSYHLSPCLCFQRCASSTHSAALFSICASTHLPLQRAWLWWINPQHPNLHIKKMDLPGFFSTWIEITKLTLSCLLLLPSASSISAFLWARRQGPTLSTLARTKPILGSFLAPILR